MNEKDYELRTKIIQEVFNDKRMINCATSAKELHLDENIHQGGDIFITEDDEFIDLELQIKDFDEDELVKYVELAEDLYEKSHKLVSIYIICPEEIDVLVREFEIKSEANFKIKLSKIPKSLVETTLDIIKNKIRHGEMLDKEDIEILKNLPLYCDKKDKNYYRSEVFKIINRLHY